MEIQPLICKKKTIRKLILCYVPSSIIRLHTLMYDTVHVHFSSIDYNAHESLFVNGMW